MMYLCRLAAVLALLGGFAVTQGVNAQGASGALLPAREGPEQPVGQRAQQIEERLIDLQVRVATMYSLAANAAPVTGRVAPPAGFRAVVQPSGPQIAAVEGEVRALSSEFGKLAGRPSLILPKSTVAHMPLPDSRADTAAASPGIAAPVPTGNGPSWSGSTVVSTNPNSAPQAAPAAPELQGELLPQDLERRPAPAPVPLQPPVRTPGGATTAWANPQAPAVRNGAPPALDNAESEYQRAYGFLLQQDYGAAQTAFSEFIQRHPKVPLAGNAQYWLGETHYVRGDYKQAAVAFLEAYEKYGGGSKAPDSLLKLALSLGKLQQKPAACSSLRELVSRFSNAPEGLLARGRAEQQRLRCGG